MVSSVRTIDRSLKVQAFKLRKLFFGFVFKLIEDKEALVRLDV